MRSRSIQSRARTRQRDREPGSSTE